MAAAAAAAGMRASRSVTFHKAVVAAEQQISGAAVCTSQAYIGQHDMQQYSWQCRGTKSHLLNTTLQSGTGVAETLWQRIQSLTPVQTIRSLCGIAFASERPSSILESSSVPVHDQQALVVHKVASMCASILWEVNVAVIASARQQENVNRLKAYKSNLVVFPRHRNAKKPKVRTICTNAALAVYACHQLSE